MTEQDKLDRLVAEARHKELLEVIIQLTLTIKQGQDKIIELLTKETKK